MVAITYPYIFSNLGAGYEPINYLDANFNTISTFLNTTFSATGLNGYNIGATTPGTGAFTSLNGGQLAGLRNRIINGDMRIDQRNSGSSQTITAAAAAAYTVDRFYATCTGANVTGQRVAGTVANQYNYQFTGAASVTGIAFGQRIEATNIYDLTNTTIAFSVDLANSLLTTVTWTAYYPTAVDNWTSRTQISTGTFTVSPTIGRYSAAIALGANVINGLSIELSVGAQTSGTWTIGRFQAEPGGISTPFERRPVSVEFASCQRYYWANTAAINIQGYAPGAFNQYMYIGLPAQMRTSPTVSAFFSGGSNVSASTIVNIGANGFQLSLLSAGAGGFLAVYSSGNTASAEL
jgi:hypothetical protein